MLGSGVLAPEFLLRDADGNEQRLADLSYAGPVLLAFFKVTCPVCQLTMPFLQRIQGGAVRIVGISQDGLQATREFCRKYGLTYQVLLDEAAGGYEVSNRFGISTVPSLFEVERGGRIGYAWQSWSKAEMEALAARAGSKIFEPGEQVPAFRPG